MNTYQKLSQHFEECQVCFVSVSREELCAKGKDLVEGLRREDLRTVLQSYQSPANRLDDTEAA